MSTSSPEDYRVVNVEIVDQGDTNTNITNGRIAALSNDADDARNQ